MPSEATARPPAPVSPATVEYLKEHFPGDVVDEALRDGTLELKDEKIGDYDGNRNKN